MPAQAGISGGVRDAVAPGPPETPAFAGVTIGVGWKEGKISMSPDAARTRLNKAPTEHRVADVDAYGAEAITQEESVDPAAPIPLVLRRELRNMRGERPTSGFTCIERIIVDPAHTDR